MWNYATWGMCVMDGMEEDGDTGQVSALDNECVEGYRVANETSQGF